MRCFLAIRLPEDIRRVIARRIDEFKSGGDGISWAREEGIHLTLRFLGECSPESVRRVADAARKAAESSPCFELAVGETGIFPDRRRPRVLWIGIRNPPDALFDLARLLEQSLERVGFAKETRPFRAHMTVARIRTPLRGPEADVLASRWLSATGETFGAFQADRFSLMESVLRTGGAVYTPMEEYRLMG